jgi:hypothetical protein
VRPEEDEVAIKEMTREQWLAVHFLAGNLAYQNVSKNLVLRLGEYLTRHPGADPNDYLARQVRLGDAFAGGGDESRQRRELQQIVYDLAASAPGLDWPPVLAWTARLVVAYRPEERGQPSPEEERQIRERIKRELSQNLKQLEEPYYG